MHPTGSLLKRWLTGTFHYRVAEHRLPYCLNEFTFRFNGHDTTSGGSPFYRLMQQAVHTDLDPLQDLLDPDSDPYFSRSCEHLGDLGPGSG